MDVIGSYSEMFDSAARSCLGPSTAAGMAHTGLAAEGRAGDGTAAGRSHGMREMTPYIFLQTKGKFCRHFHRVRDTESRVQTANGTDDSCSQLPRAPGPRVRDVPSRGGSRSHRHLPWSVVFSPLGAKHAECGEPSVKSALPGVSCLAVLWH